MRHAYVLTCGLTSLLLVATISLAQQTPISTPGELSRKAQGEMPNGEVQVRGILVNKGTNYFTDQKFMLRDPDTGEEIFVRPWLPLSISRVPGGNQSSAEGTLSVQSDFVGKEVILKGHFSEGQLKGIGTVDVLTVEEAQIIGD